MLVIKAAHRLRFTLEEVSDLIEAGRRTGGDAVLQVRVREKLAKVEERIENLVLIGRSCTHPGPAEPVHAGTKARC